MTTFQFDENNECKSYIKHCNKEGLAAAKRFPRRHKNKQFSDPEMLNLCLSLGGVLVTFDHHMIDDHEPYIPEKSPGIIIIQHSRKIPYTMTQKSAERIIAQFKKTIADWHQVPFENSIVRITDESITIGRKLADGVTYDCHKELTEPNCGKEIREHLASNAADKQNG